MLDEQVTSAHFTAGRLALVAAQVVRAREALDLVTADAWWRFPRRLLRRAIVKVWQLAAV